MTHKTRVQPASIDFGRYSGGRGTPYDATGDKLRYPGKSVLPGMIALGLAIFFSAPASAQTAAQKCLWVDPPGPSSTTTYTPWTVTDVGVLWDTETRTCCEVWNGPAVWYTEISARTCTPSVGIAIGPAGPSGTAGFAYPRSTSVVNPVNGPGTASRYTRQEKCLWTSNTVLGVNQTFNVDKYTHQALYNEWTNADVTFDGANVPLGSAIDLLGVGLGQHQYVVTRTDGDLTDSLTFNINLLPSYYLEFVGLGPTVNPSCIARFHNDSPDAITVEFSTVSLMTGVETNLGTDNVVVVPAQGTYDVQLDLYTATGYVVAPGQVPTGAINATFGSANGVLLARFECSIVTAGGPCDPENCPAGATLEGEPVCGANYVDSYNGGCNSTPNVFSSIACGATVCGAGGNYSFNGLSYRDEDWYQINVGADSCNITVSLCASFASEITIMDGNVGCGSITNTCGPVFGTPGAEVSCGPVSVSGLVWIFVSTSSFSGVPCGAPYILTVDTGDCCVSNATESKTWGQIKGMFR